MAFNFGFSVKPDFLLYVSYRYSLDYVGNILASVAAFLEIFVDLAPRYDDHRVAFFGVQSVHRFHIQAVALFFKAVDLDDKIAHGF